ncbi:NAD(P)/FAD-dependent oxidoreductase [Rhodococcus sp. PAMC28707]|uniref:flavin-containing monooxygenase n=1 Tax=unclassified Rhodococcus (in: high G+C Gram-positive bacteria) TaxID=192944 RepID=UPI00109DE7D4|nr:MULTISPECIES: NAD(P)/FAD-dependent oxidoreductase [unclassified Rhodococcus (in: high G+C Gram-positive bacteria)]QCB49165.1 NAD(P)/FAD-dependent oxidoreductase [Rhodococcus sp. PAMC28705]QCB59147.1 NAD(P)/FAD-dependent oxidoreductase [Rhodococcus sp. PAMC28707]
MTRTNVDVVVVGAGLAGLYAMHKFRGQGLDVQGFEAASDVGGTWYFNRYPGARCDVESVDYSYSFDDELQQEWDWSERYATQPEILAYLEHVADRFDLRSGFEFDTRVVSATFDEQAARWNIVTDKGEKVTARFCVLATGALSTTNLPNIPGRDSFGGEILHTGDWPRTGVDFAGKRVGVIGTGSSGIQSIPLIAEQAATLHVFQRTPNFSVPASNRPLDEETRREQKATYAERRRKSWASGGGSPFVSNPKSALEVPADEREAEFEQYWELGGVLFAKTFADQMSDIEANNLARGFAERKIRAVIEDQAVADVLIPTDHPIGSKRIVTDSGYFATYNRDNVTLVNLREAPITAIDETGIATAGAHYDLDMIVFATGFDAITGSLDRIDIRGRDGVLLREKWTAGPQTLHGIAAAGFPNLFLITGPGSPGVLANMVLGSEQHVNWIADAIAYVDSNDYAIIEAGEQAAADWMSECAAVAAKTLFPQANSWYMGANIEGKPRVFMMYAGGFGNYGKKIAEVAAEGYKGFELTVLAASQQ